MSSPLIYRNIQKHISLDDAEKQQFNERLVTQKLSKKELILRQDQVCRSIYFVASGSLRAFHTNQEGKESTVMFAISGWWITDMQCFTRQQPALVSIEALEESEVVGLAFHALERLYQQIPKFERFFRILFQNAYIREQQRALDSISFTTEERYQRFVKKHPDIVRKISQKQIASYLGVTPEFLSSIKKK